MKLKKIIEQLERIAPTHLAEDWDNVGLLAGDPNQNIKKVLLTIDLTAPVAAEAKTKKADLIIAYHPPLFQPIKKIIPGQGPSPLLYELIRSGRAVYSLHTALDIVKGGVNDALAELIGIADPQPLQQTSIETADMCKLVVFVPQNDVTAVSEAVFAAGAGNIGPAGKYSKCSFRSPGTGTFHCGPASKPAIGKPGRFEQVDELRFETIVPKTKLSAVIKAMLTAHSYEEPAFDLIPLLDTPSRLGLGRFGRLKKPTTVDNLITTIKKTFKLKTIGLIGPHRKTVTSAAVGAGSCGTLLRDVIKNGCDFYLTGELKHHHALELQAAGVTTICLGHSHSERFMLTRLARQLTKTCAPVTFTCSNKDKDPFTWL